MIKEDLVLPLDYSKIPNFKYISDQYKNLPYDPENLYTVPYFWERLEFYMIKQS